MSIEPIRGELRSSLIVDPANGLLPGNDLYKQRIGPAMATVLSAMDGPEQRPAPERCLASTTAQPPILSIRNGVNLHQIVQTADSFVFVAEFISATRIIRLNSKPLPAAITSWLGDSVGHWEGDVLVVETRGFTENEHLRLAPPDRFLVSPRMVVTERFARVAADRIDYTFVVEDPTYYTQPWAVSRISCVATSCCWNTPATRRTTPWCTSWKAHASASVPVTDRKAHRHKNKAHCSPRCTTSCGALRDAS